jgi:hypothetical protein
MYIGELSSSSLGTGDCGVIGFRTASNTYTEGMRICPSSTVQQSQIIAGPASFTQVTASGGIGSSAGTSQFVTTNINGSLNLSNQSNASAGTPNVASISQFFNDSFWNGTAPVTETWKILSNQLSTGLAGISGLIYQFSPPAAFTGLPEISFQNTMGATSSQNQVIPSIALSGFEWTGSNTLYSWVWGETLGTGTNPTHNYGLAFSGGPGAKTVSIPYPMTTGTINGVAHTGTCTTGSITPSSSAGGTATGTCTLGSSATGHPGVAAATDGSVQGIVISQVSVSGTTATVTLTTVIAGSPTAKSYNVTVF